jgi:hypothetical protein
MIGDIFHPERDEICVVEWTILRARSLDFSASPVVVPVAYLLLYRDSYKGSNELQSIKTIP